MANNFSRVNVSITASTGGLTAGLANASKQVEGFSSRLRRIDFATTFMAATNAVNIAVNAVKSFAGAISGAVDAAVSLGEEQSKSTVIFGASAAAVGEFAKSAANIGISEAAALKATGTFGNLFRAIGLSEDQSAKFSTSMTALAADLASFNNTSIDEAMQALGAGLRGEAEPLRRFGVLLDDATLRQQALSMGLVDSVKTALTPSIKAQAAYAAILNQTKLAQGDFTRTSGSLANQQRILYANFQNLSGELGKAFIPLFQTLVNTFTQIIPYIQAATAQFVAFLTQATPGLEGASLAATVLGGAIRIVAGAVTFLYGAFQMLYGFLSPVLAFVLKVAGVIAGVAEAIFGKIGPGLSQMANDAAGFLARTGGGALTQGSRNVTNPFASFDDALAQAIAKAADPKPGGDKDAERTADATERTAKTLERLANNQGGTLAMATIGY